MKVLVTGHKGFIGRNMVEWMTNEGWEVEGWDWKPNQFPHVTDYQWIVHLGAVTDPNETDVEKVLIQNCDFTKRLIKSCQVNEVNLQYASSWHVYGNTRDFSEHAQCHPQTPYAWSKYIVDRHAFTHPHNSFVQCFRYFNVYGKYMHLRGDHASIISKWTEEARKHRKIQVWDNAEHIKRDWVWVGDVCRLHIDFIKQVKGSGLWNCGTGLSHSLLDIAEEIAQIEDAEIEFIPTPNQHLPLRSCADLTNLKATVGKRKWLNVFEWLA